MKYQRSEEVRDIAEELIEENHPHLAGRYMEYIFHEKAATKGGKITFATAQKVSGLPAMLIRNMLPTHDPTEPNDAEFFLISVAQDMWEKLKPYQQVALIDHELCHCGVDKSGDTDKLIIVGHDVTEFDAVVRRHGLWMPDLKHFAKALKDAPQLDFAEEMVGGKAVLTP